MDCSVASGEYGRALGGHGIPEVLRTANLVAEPWSGLKAGELCGMPGEGKARGEERCALHNRGPPLHMFEHHTAASAAGVDEV